MIDSPILPDAVGSLSIAWGIHNSTAIHIHSRTGKSGAWECHCIDANAAWLDSKSFQCHGCGYVCPQTACYG